MNGVKDLLTFTGVVALAAVASHLPLLIENILTVPLITVDALLLIALAYSHFRREEPKSERRTLYNIPCRISNPKTSNMFISRWNSLHLNYGGKLPLNRLAFLKARYCIGPFFRFRFASEVSLSVLKAKAMRPSVEIRVECKDDECHPVLHATEFTETYVQYRALMYREQYIQNVGLKYQVTLPERAENMATPQSSLEDINEIDGAYNMTSPSYLAADRTSLSLTSINKNFEKNPEEEERQAEFKREMAKTKEKLDRVKSAFKIIRREEKDRKRGQN